LSGIIANNNLYLGKRDKMVQVFEMTTSLLHPLRTVQVIYTMSNINKVLRVGNKLLLGQEAGYLQVVDINNYNIIRTHWF
jgi:hypothetical protein